MRYRFRIAQLFAACLFALLNACGSGDEDDPQGTAQGGRSNGGGTAACPAGALDPSLEWASEPFATRVSRMAGVFMVQGTAAMENARARVEVRLTGGNTFLGGSCMYARVPADIRYNIRLANGGEVVKDWVPIAFNVYTNARRTAAGAEATFNVDMQSASISFFPDVGDGVLLQNFVLGPNLYVLPASP